MRTLIADDHPLLRRALLELLRGAHPDWIFHEAGSFPEVRQACAEQAIDLASIDLLMPGLSGPRDLAALVRDYPELRVVVLTGTDDRSTILDCFSAGVHGYVLKSSAAEHLQRAVEMIIDGGIYMPSTVVGGFGAVSRGALRPSGFGEPAPMLPRSDLAERLDEIEGLTGRQRDVLTLLAQGCSTKDIARKLDLGIGTVKVHLAGLYKALGARNRMEAVVKAGQALQA